MNITILSPDGSLLPYNGSNGISIIGPDGAYMPNNGTNGVTITDETGALRANDGSVPAYSILDANGAIRAYDAGVSKSILEEDGSLAVTDALEAQIAALFANDEQGAWYDPSDFETLFQDSAGTTPVTAVGQPVGRMLDKSGNDNHILQGTSAARPILRQDGNGKYYLEFDGVDDILASVPFIANGAEVFGAIAVAMPTNGNAWMGIWGHGLFTPSESVLLQRRGPDPWMQFRVDNGETPGGAFNAAIGGDLTALEATPHITAARVGPSVGRQLYVDGVEDAVDTWQGGTLAFPTARPLQIAMTSDGGIGRFSFYGLVYRSAATQPASSVADDYLANKAGVTL